MSKSRDIPLKSLSVASTFIGNSTSRDGLVG